MISPYFEFIDQRISFPSNTVPFYRERLPSEGGGDLIFGQLYISSLQGFNSSDLYRAVRHIERGYALAIKVGDLPGLTIERMVEIDRNRLPIFKLRDAIEKKSNELTIQMEREAGLAPSIFEGRIMQE
ncbi:hypothetical protein HOD38_03580 [archaeon]|jgi:hypothetical protein|nr:hypothetical protein [archaeon]MBT4397321.1 hypothetical protein [archaeon]MBT4440701.1 hypothetical protein [archaeon]